MKTWLYVFEDGYGAYWHNKPISARDLNRLRKEHGALVHSERIK